MRHLRSLYCHLLPIQTQYILASRSSFLWTLVLSALPAEFTLLFPGALSHFVLPFYICCRILSCSCWVSDVALSLHLGISETQVADLAYLLLSGFPHPTSKLLVFWKEQVCVGMAFAFLKGVSVEYMSLHALNFLLPTGTLLLCLAAANSAKRLLALSALSP